MTGPDDAGETRLRKMFRDAALQIDPGEPALGSGVMAPRVSRAAPYRLTLVVVFCLAIATAVLIDVHPWARSGSTGLNGAGSGSFLAVRSDGAVELLAPETGAVLRTLVGPSPVDSDGRHLSRPYAVTSEGDTAYVGYLEPSAIIESVPLGGGTLKYVTGGLYPAANSAGTRLAFVRFPDAGGKAADSDSTGAVVVRDLDTGSEQSVYPMTGFTLVSGLSWSRDGTQLALTGIFMSKASGPLLGDSLLGVQILAVDQPRSDTNPHFIGTPTPISSAKNTPTWSEAQFVGSGHNLAVLANNTNGPCAAISTTVLSVDPATGQTTTLATFPFEVSRAVFDQPGDLVAFQRNLCPSSAPASTTTSTTAPGSTPVRSPGASGGGSFSASPIQGMLERWSRGTSSVLATNVVTETFVTLNS